MRCGLNLLAGGMLCVLSSAASLSAEDFVLGQMYGSGVHAYFVENYIRSHDYLTEAIDGGSKDPRNYYFRGLDYLKLGRQTEAEMDFTKGAQLEALDVNRFYNVGKSLERVQGSARMAMEEHRIKARMAALKRDDEIRRVRYDSIQQEQGRVLRTPADGVVPPPVDESPFADPTAAAPATAPGAANDPFAQPAGNDPFAQPAAPPAAPPAAAPADGQSGKVLGAIGKSLGKAFAGSEGQPAPPVAPAGADPFAQPPAAAPAGNDPFAQPPATAPAAPVAAPPAVPAGADPFAEPAAAAPAAAPAGADPFAEPAAVAPAAAAPAAAPVAAAPADDPFAQ